MTALPAMAADAGAKYVDCSATAAGTPDGSAAAPFTTLAQINAVTLAPGDSVLFKRGATCLGTYAPVGNGSSANPITISAYGAGTARPVILTATAPWTRWFCATWKAFKCPSLK